MEIHLMPDQDKNPTRLVDPHATVLSLQRSFVGWRIVIPAAAIKRLARGTRPPAGKAPRKRRTIFVTLDP